MCISYIFDKSALTQLGRVVEVASWLLPWVVVVMSSWEVVEQWPML
jgi:hypothetical protein